MGGFRRFTRIAGLSDSRRFPRVGKVRLGVKKTSGKGSEYPAEVDHFVVRADDSTSEEMAERFAEVYPGEPKALEIMLPVDDVDVVFPQEYKRYGGAGLLCRGDGCRYSRVERGTGEITEGDCPTPADCDFAKDPKWGVVCKHIASLTFLLPRVTIAGVWQIDSSSINAMIDVNSGLDYIRAIVGKIEMVPLVLRRVKRETMFEGKKGTHYPLVVNLAPPQVAQKMIGGISKARSVYVLPEATAATLPRELEAPKEAIPEELYPENLVRETRGEPPAPPRTLDERLAAAEDEPPPEITPTERIEEPLPPPGSGKKGIF
jgi:hypothetical protein